MRENLTKFLLEIENLYPIEAKRKDRVIQMSVDFLLQFCLDRKIDWKKAKDEVLNNYSYNKFPDLAFLRDCIVKSYVFETNIAKDEGCLVLMIMPDGYIYSFEITSFGHSIEELKQRINNRLKEQKKNCTVKIFPKGSTLIGNKVFIPVKPDKEGEEETNKIVEIA